MPFIKPVLNAKTYRYLFSLVAVVAFALVALERYSAPSISYWVWAGISVKDIPTRTPVYLYQGIFRSSGEHVLFERKGLYPYPIEPREIYLVFRLEGGFPQNNKVPEIMQSIIAAWEKHGVKITGIQLDVDTATSQLLEYGNYLKWIKAALPPAYRLSITGLGDWIIWGNPKAIEHIGISVDEVVFQLYQGRQSFPDIDRYLKRLRTFNIPFKVGLLTNNSSSFVSLVALRFNLLFKGIVYFVQK